MILLLVLTIFLLLSFLSFFLVEQQTVSVIERFGKFHKIANPGLNFKVPFIDYKAGSINLRIMQLDVEIETKTFDNVFVHLNISVQYKVLPEKVFEAFYTLENYEKQITSFVFDAVRAEVPKLILDDVFAKKDDIANAVQKEINDQMASFGFLILKSLVTDISPDKKVKNAMNEINEAQRLRIAANERGEAEKILKIKLAEAEAEGKILQGKGIAGQRNEIVNGLKESLENVVSNLPEASTHEAILLVLMTQYFDTLKEMAANGKMNTVFLNQSPEGFVEVKEQVRRAVYNSIIKDEGKI